MEIKIENVKIEHKAQLKEMLINYFKEINGDNRIDFDYPYFDLYWTEENRIPLEIIANGVIAGFVLINDFIVCKVFNGERSIAEFYIKPAFRKQGIGAFVAHRLFEKYRGKWEIRQELSNTGAQNFWHKTIKTYTNGKFEELNYSDEDYQCIMQLFIS